MLRTSQVLFKNRLSGGAATADLRRPLVDVLPCEEKGTDKMRGCVDLRNSNSCIRYEHFKMEWLHTIQQLIHRNNLITKVDLSDFYMHFPIGHADRRYMPFMWEGKKHQCIGMPLVWPRLRDLPQR